MTKSVFVTGANGFIGAKVVLGLRSAGYSVHVRIPDQSAIPPHKKFENVRAESFGILRHQKIDTVVHLAAINSSSVKGVDSELLRLVNVDFTQQLAETSFSSGVRRFIHLSSAKVLGEGGKGAYSESSQINPQDEYAQSKADAEIKLVQASKQSEMEVVILRPPVVYGPSGGVNMLRLFGLVERGIPLPLGMVRNRRSFLFVENLVNAIELSIKHPLAGNQIYMVSDGRSVSTPELVALIANELRSSVRMFNLPIPLCRLTSKLVGKEKLFQSLYSTFEVDDSKIKRELGWMPPLTLEQGLKATAEWYRNHFS